MFVFTFVFLFLFDDDVLIHDDRFVPAGVPADGGADRRPRGSTSDRALVTADLTSHHGAGGAADRRADGLVAAPVEVGATRRHEYSGCNNHVQASSPYDL